MLDMAEINNTIDELENGTTTFATCEKLANLYVVRDHMTAVDVVEDEVVTEYSDILPRYVEYCDIKRKYQLNEVAKDNIILAMDNVCNEINEFVHTLYSNTHTQSERDLIVEMVHDISKWLEK